MIEPFQRIFQQQAGDGGRNRSQNDKPTQPGVHILQQGGHGVRLANGSEAAQGSQDDVGKIPPKDRQNRQKRPQMHDCIKEKR